MSISKSGDFTLRLEKPLSTILEESFVIKDYRMLRPKLYKRVEGKYEYWRLIIENSGGWEIQFSYELDKSLTEEDKLEIFSTHVEDELIRRDILDSRKVRVMKIREDDENKFTILQRGTIRPDY